MIIFSFELLPKCGGGRKREAEAITLTTGHKSEGGDIHLHIYINN